MTTALKSYKYRFILEISNLYTITKTVELMAVLMRLKGTTPINMYSEALPLIPYNGIIINLLHNVATAT